MSDGQGPGPHGSAVGTSAHAVRASEDPSHGRNTGQTRPHGRNVRESDRTGEAPETGSHGRSVKIPVAQPDRRRTVGRANRPKPTGVFHNNRLVHKA